MSSAKFETSSAGMWSRSLTKRKHRKASLEKDYAEIEDTLIQFLASEYLGHYLYRLEQEANIQILREGYR